MDEKFELERKKIIEAEKAALAEQSHLAQ